MMISFFFLFFFFLDNSNEVWNGRVFLISKCFQPTGITRSVQARNLGWLYMFLILGKPLPQVLKPITDQICSNPVYTSLQCVDENPRSN